MKRKLLLPLLVIFTSLGLQAQVTQINSNKSLEADYPLSNNKSIYISHPDSTLWVTDGSLAGTFQLSSTIKFIDDVGSTGFLNGQLIFVGTNPATGAELYITDGTPGGTTLLADINPGAPGSSPDFESAVFNGFIYFTATRPAEGRELWRTNGTLAGTTLVKDIVAGPAGSNAPGNYHLFATPAYLLFAARTAASGVELWRSDGTDAGTVLLKEINTGHANADSSNPHSFYPLNNTVLFVATNAINGEEVWRADGTAGGTYMLADINPTGSSTKIDLAPGISYPLLTWFHTFNNRAYFNAYDGTSAGLVWSTDGTQGNTAQLKDIVSTPDVSFVGVLNAVNLAGKFIFPVSDLSGRYELWQSDGTPKGTVLFKSFVKGAASDIPLIMVPPNVNNAGITQPLFQGNKFFFVAASAQEGYELWVSDGTVANTHIVKDVNPGTADGIQLSSFVYTSQALFFPADNGSDGPELWRTDGTNGGTNIVADIVTGLTGSDPRVDFFLVNGKVLFGANNLDEPMQTDLYAVDGVFTPLPVKLGDFTVSPQAANAILQWHTLQELNTKEFTVQRSFDGNKFENIGTVAAAGTSDNVHAYTLTDAGVMNSGKSTVYYRLVSTDRDGSNSFSQVITLRIKNTGQWNVRLVSNPVPGYLNIVLTGITQNIQLSVIDMQGRRLYTSASAAINGQVRIPLDQLSHGTYYLVTETVNEKKTIQFLK